MTRVAYVVRSLIGPAENDFGATRVTEYLAAVLAALPVTAAAAAITTSCCCFLLEGTLARRALGEVVLVLAAHLLSMRLADVVVARERLALVELDLQRLDEAHEVLLYRQVVLRVALERADLVGQLGVLVAQLAHLDLVELVALTEHLHQRLALLLHLTQLRHTLGLVALGRAPHLALALQLALQTLRDRHLVLHVVRTLQLGVELLHALERLAAHVELLVERLVGHHQLNRLCAHRVQRTHGLVQSARRLVAGVEFAREYVLLAHELLVLGLEAEVVDAQLLVLVLERLHVAAYLVVELDERVHLKAMLGLHARVLCAQLVDQRRQVAHLHVEILDVRVRLARLGREVGLDVHAARLLLLVHGQQLAV